MWVKIISLVLPMAIRIIEHFLDKSNAEQDRKKEFLAFIESIEPSLQDSVRLSKRYKDMKRRLLK